MGVQKGFAGRGQKQHARGVTIEPMHELEKARRPRSPECLNDAKGDPAAAVYRDSGGLVDSQKSLPLKKGGQTVGELCRLCRQAPR